MFLSFVLQRFIIESYCNHSLHPPYKHKEEEEWKGSRRKESMCLDPKGLCIDISIREGRDISIHMVSSRGSYIGKISFDV